MANFIKGGGKTPPKGHFAISFPKYGSKSPKNMSEPSQMGVQVVLWDISEKKQNRNFFSTFRFFEILAMELDPFPEKALEKYLKKHEKNMKNRCFFRYTGSRVV